MPSMEANKLTTAQFLQDLGSPLPSLIILQLEIPFDTVLHVLKLAQRASVPVLLNPAPALGIPDEAYPKIGHSVLNESEAALLSSMHVALLKNLATIARIVEDFKAKGVANVILTMGSNGVHYSGADRQCGHIPAKNVPSINDTTAAGDTFVGASALAIVKPGSVSLGNAVQIANKAAAITGQRKGT